MEKSLRSYFGFTEKINITMLEGLVLKIVLIVVLTILFTAILSGSESPFSVISSGKDYTLIEFNLPCYEQVYETVESEVYIRFYSEKGGLLMNKGLPELLTFSTALRLPATGSASVEEQEIVSSNIEYDVNVFPSQGYNLVIDEEKGFLKDYKLYTENVEYPHRDLVIGSPVIMRDIRMAALTIKPFKYNPAKRELTVIETMRVKVRYNQDQVSENELRTPRRALSRSFEPLYRGVTLNYEQFHNLATPYQQRSILVVRHHSQSIDTIVDMFVDWKRDKGFIVNAIDTESYSTNIAIRNYIRTAYNVWQDPPEYVVIIGGGTGPLAVPYFFAHFGPGDHPYTLMEGDDDISDIFVGRISVDSAYQLATVWNKIRTYEQNLHNDEANQWHQRQLLVGDPRVSGISTINTNKYIKEIMNRRFDNYSYVEVYEGNFRQGIDAALNQGVGFFSFRGLELMAGWLPTNEGDFDNFFRTPNATLITCNTLDFRGGKQVEPFFRTGTPTTPRGGVSGIGMTTNYTLTSFNSCLAGGIYHGLIIDDVRTMGEALVSGKTYIWQVFGNLHPSEPPQYSHWANLIGDPSMDVWKQTPQPMNVVYEENIPPGANSISITVKDNDNQPLKDAWVTVRKPDNSLFSTGYTDETGRIVHVFPPVVDAGNIRLTVTKPDYQPHLGGFAVQGEPSVSFLRIDPDGQPVPSKDFYFDLIVKNHSDAVKTGLTGTISSDDKYIGIPSAMNTFPDIQPMSEARSEDSFSLTVSPSVPDNHQILLNLTVKDGDDRQWLSHFKINMNNGRLEPLEFYFNEDDQRNIEPDETGELFISIKNTGSLDLSGISAYLRSLDEQLVVIDSVAYFGDIAAGETVDLTDSPFKLHAEETIIPGMSFEAELEFFNNSGFRQGVILEIPVGNVDITDPFGPDAYGYWCYDEGDVGYTDVPVYEWIEIAPEKGGPGIDTGLESDYMDNQQVMYKELPFEFKFYGINYNVISICSNGWISFGETEQSTHKNWRLPGALGPYAMVAAFWENLSLREGGVYTYHSEEEHIFIIQWQNALNIMKDAPQTFQIILYCPEMYPTITGDGAIKFQYKVFNNVNNGANLPVGTGNWGNYATIGIADHTCTTGLEYTFNNRYPQAAKPLSHESAIFFTTGCGKHLNTENQDVTRPGSKLYPAYPNPFNSRTNIAFSIEAAGDVIIDVYDIKGRKINRLADKHFSSGRHTVSWSGDNYKGQTVTSGIYFYRMLFRGEKGSSYRETGKMLLLK